VTSIIEFLKSIAIGIIQFKEDLIMATTKRVYTLRLSEKEIFDKIKKIAETNKRSIAMQIEYALEIYIKDYEKINGKID
jgi:hypothetical protein